MAFIKKRIGFVLPLVLLLMFAGCSKDEAIANEELTGIWFKDVDYADDDQKRTMEWVFKDNGRFEIAYAEFRKSTGIFLGFSLLQTGDYEYKNGVLYMRNMLSYSYAFDGAEFLPDAEYLMEKNSFFARSGASIQDNSASTSFIDLKSKLVLTYLECNDTFTSADCIGQETLRRR